MELVSVIIPTYKRSSMLDRAINSCLEQSYKELEVIVIDDNNPDSQYRVDTAKFMSQYSENPRVRYVEMPKNLGGVAARNMGISVAKGSYIAFLDDDDYFFEKKTEKQLNFMIDNNLDASFTANEFYNETKQRIIDTRTYDNFDEYDDVFKFHLVEMIVGTQTFMYKKDVLDAIGGFTEVSAGQEYYLMYKTLQAGYKVGCLNEALTRTCIHSGERITTSKAKLDAERDLYELKKAHCDILNYPQKRRIKYTYKYNVWQKHKSAGGYKQFAWLVYTAISHPMIIAKRVLRLIRRKLK